MYVQGDQKVFDHLMITIQKVKRNVESVPRQSPDIYWHAELCSFIPNSNYVIMVGDWNCLKFCIFAWFFYCNHQVHRDLLITLYIILITLYIPLNFSPSRWEWKDGSSMIKWAPLPKYWTKILIELCIYYILLFSIYF
jgi:hypothetical protein